MKKRKAYWIILALVGLLASSGTMTGPALGAGLQDCLDMDLDSCDFVGFQAMCEQLFSNPQPCDKLCKSNFAGDDVGTCVICCNEVMPQLNMNQPKELELE
jgi:hypothetical protein